MRGHNIWFQWEIRKIIPELSSNTPSYLEPCSHKRAKVDRTLQMFGLKTVFIPDFFSGIRSNQNNESLFTIYFLLVTWGSIAIIMWRIKFELDDFLY